MENKILIVILLASVANYFPRMLPAVFLSKARIPEAVVRWLDLVPAAVLAALVAPEILMPGGSLNITTGNKNLLAAIPAFIVASLTKSLSATVLTGIAAAAALHYWGL